MGREYTILLRGLRFFGFHGVLPAEQENGQRFELDLEVLFERPDPACDEIDSTLDYVKLYRTVEPHFSRERYELIETCAERISEDLLNRFPQIRQVVVTLKKPSAPVPCICDHFGVRICRQR